LIGLALVVLAFALVLLFLVERRWKKMGLPAGKLVYADTGKWTKCDKTLFSPRYGLAGRPDYLFREKGRLIPVEVKSGPSPLTPYPSHIFQLAAYCLLVEEEEGVAPSYGVIAYRDAFFRVDYSSELKAELLRIMDEMRRCQARGEEPPFLEGEKCHHCGYNYLCFAKLRRE